MAKAKTHKKRDSREWAIIEITRSLELCGYSVYGKAAEELRDLLFTVYYAGLNRGRYFRMRKPRAVI